MVVTKSERGDGADVWNRGQAAADLVLTSEGYKLEFRDRVTPWRRTKVMTLAKVARRIGLTRCRLHCQTINRQHGYRTRSNELLSAGPLA
jgi:hypothetical protein